MKVRIKENSWVAKLAAAKMKADKVAIVFGNTIHLHNTSRNEFLHHKEWVCHELKHVHQYQQNGFVGFIAKYLFDWVKNGYYGNRFEVEARASEGDVGYKKLPAKQWAYSGLFAPHPPPSTTRLLVYLQSKLQTPGCLFLILLLNLFYKDDQGR